MTEKIRQNAWEGIWYPVSRRKDKAIILISGSEGGMEHAGKMARYLQDNGIPALALGYFKTQNTSKYLDRIPMEIVRNALLYLKREGYEKIGIVGASVYTV